jgi:hypothetical protein
MGKIKDELMVLGGKTGRDLTYSSSNSFSGMSRTRQEFQRSVGKLFNVDLWSNIRGMTSEFQLHNSHGLKRQVDKPSVNDYIKILLPGPMPENWVIIWDIKEEENLAEFTVSPATKPNATGIEPEEQIQHFFVKEATSTFRVQMLNLTIFAFEIGKNEVINNQGEEAGDRKLINTLTAEGGWAGFQKFQWKKLTDYLVHRVEL